MNRAERRRLDAIRRRQTADRISEQARPALRDREIALLRRVVGYEVPADLPAPYVILLAEDVEPLAVAWKRLPSALDLLGIELHPDTLAAVAKLRAADRIPAITNVGGWTNVYPLERVLMTRGGSA